MNNEIFIGSKPLDYKKLGLSYEISPWEDRMRTEGKEKTFEWWYFDAEYDNGMKVVVIFYTKDRFDFYGNSCATVTIDITLPNGTNIYKLIYSDNEQIVEKSREHCDISINECYAKYKNGLYELYFIYDNIEYSCIMEATAPMWRPYSGHFYFDNAKENYFAWLVPLPSANIKGFLKYNTEIIELSGYGYHDHNWGNCSMDTVIDNWYWIKSKIGPYTIISYNITSVEKNEITTLAMFKNGKLLNPNDYDAVIKFEEPFKHEITGKILHDKIVIQKKLKNYKFKIQYLRDHDIVAYNLIDTMGFSIFSKFIKRLLNQKPTYLRIVGEGILTIVNEKVSTNYYGEGLWEQMKFKNY